MGQMTIMTDTYARKMEKNHTPTRTAVTGTNNNPETTVGKELNYNFYNFYS